MTPSPRATVARRATARLLLRPPALADLPVVVALFARPELVAHRPHPTPDPPEASAARLNRDMAHWREHGFGRWAIEREGEVIGFGGLTRREDVEGLNISYHLRPESWGRGYASELVAEALSVAFGPLGAPCVTGMVRPANPVSRRVLERAGFVVLGERMLDGAPTTILVRQAPGLAPAG